jgi:hypothetical protein
LLLHERKILGPAHNKYKVELFNKQERYPATLILFYTWNNQLQFITSFSHGEIQIEDDKEKRFVNINR